MSSPRRIFAATVLERRSEIGLRRALGATRGQIRAQFLTEAIMLSLAGGATGVILGAAAVTAYARTHGLAPLARVRSMATAGVPPRVMGIGPVPATAKALHRAGLTLADIGLIELNEAFAAQALAVMREWGFGAADHERTNVHGSGISLGHPVGATGGRMLATLARELNRRDARYGLETMCIGGGQGLAAIFERVGPR